MAEDTLPWETQQDGGDSLPWETQNTSTKQPMSGSFWDSFWSQSVEGKVLNGFGLGASQGWGAAIHQLAPDQEQLFKNYPSVAKVYNDSNDATSKAFHEAITRPNLASAYFQKLVGIPVSGIAALIGGISGAGVGLAESMEGTAQHLKTSVNIPEPQKGPFKYGLTNESKFEEYARKFYNNTNPEALLGTYVGGYGALVGSIAKGENFGGEVGSGLPDTGKVADYYIQKALKEAPKPTPPAFPEGMSEELPKQPLEQPGVLPEHLNEEPINTPRPIADSELRDILDENLEDEFQISGQKIHQNPAEDYWGMFNTSRAHGMIGEGEQGFFNTFPLDEKMVEERTQAAIEAGLPEVPEIQPPVTDPYVVATGINPELMAKHYSIHDQLDELREKKETLLEKTAPFPDPDFVTSEVERLEAKKKLSTKEQNRLEDLYEFKKAYKELIRIHQAVLDLDEQLRDISPDVAATLEHAKSLIPSIQAEQQSQWYREASKYSQESARLDAEQRAKPLEYSEPIGPLGHDEEVDSIFKKLEGKIDQNTVEPLSGFSTVPGRYTSGLKEPSGAPTKLVQPVPETLSGIVPETSKASPGGSLKPFEGTGDKKISGAALATEARAIESGLQSSLGDLPTFDSVVFKDQAPAIAELFLKDPERAQAIGLGERAAPKDMIPELVQAELERRARLEGDWDLVRKIANSKLTRESTTLAQRLRARGENGGTTPSAVIRAVQEAKQAATKKRGQFEKAIKRVVDQMKDITPDKKTWRDHLEDIRCK